MQDNPTLLCRNFKAVAYVGVQDDDDLDEAIEQYDKPSYEFVQTSAVFLPAENCIRIKLDFPGNSDDYGFYIILFLYDDQKVLGTLHYVHDAHSANERIDGHFELSWDRLRLFTTAELQNQGAESFCLLITR
jgi:hypothetical protein